MIEIIKKPKKIESIDAPQKSYKNFQTYFQSLINHIRKNTKVTSYELSFVLQEIMNKYKEFEDKRTIGIVKLESYKGKSDLQLIKKPDEIIAITYQKPKKGGEPREMRIKISKDELNACIIALNQLNKGELIETRDVAEKYFWILGITENNKGNPLFQNGQFIYENFFGWRIGHVHLVTCLNVLNVEGMIEYGKEKKGYSRVINNSISIQQILPESD